MKARGPGWWRKVYTRLWSDPKFLALPDAVRVFAFYVLTGPQGNRIGIFKFSVASAAEDLAIDLSDARERLHRVCEVFGWHYDQAARVLWLPRWWNYNPPPTQKTFLGFLSDLQDVPESPLVQSFAAFTRDLPDHALKTFRERLADRMTSATASAMESGIGTSFGSEIGSPMARDLEVRSEKSDSEADGDREQTVVPWPSNDEERETTTAAAPRRRQAAR